MSGCNIQDLPPCVKKEKASPVYVCEDVGIMEEDMLRLIPFDLEAICMDGQPGFVRESRNESGGIDRAFFSANGVEVATPTSWTSGDCSVSSGSSTVFVSTVSNENTISTGLQYFSVENTGGANGTLDGATLTPGDKVEVSAFLNHASNIYKTVGGIEYNAIGTTFLIVQLPS